MNKNLPLELWSKHADALGLIEPLMVKGESALFGIDVSPAKSAVVFLPKSKALIDMMLAKVSSIVDESGKVALVGEKSAGIDSAKKAFEKNIGPVEEKLFGSHSVLYVGKNTIKRPFDLESFVTVSDISYKDETLKLASLPGVFSAGELDPGTRLLLDNLPLGAKRFLDLACGSGVVGALYKKLSPETEVVMADSSALALESARRTLAANILEAGVTGSDVFSNINGAFDLIAVNPPFHSGVATDYSFIEVFARDAAKHLSPRGSIFLVANSFLPYEKTLSKIGSTRKLVDDGKFSVFDTRRD